VVARADTGEKYDLEFDDDDSDDDDDDHAAHLARDVPAKRVRVLSNPATAPESEATSTDDQDNGDSNESNNSVETFKLKVGARIRGHWQGEMEGERGVVTRVRSDGTYDVCYEDDDVEKRLPAKLLRVEVEANFAGRGYWYLGTLVRIQEDGTFTVHYDFNDTETDIDASNIRLLDGDGDQELNEERLHVGRLVEAFYKPYNEWYQAVIKDVWYRDVELVFESISDALVSCPKKSVRIIPSVETDDFIDYDGGYDRPCCARGHEMVISAYSQANYSTAGNKFVW
jgi:hypothetical protein